MKREQVVARVREVVADFPEAETSSETGQHAAFKVRGKNYAWQTNDHHGDGRVAISLKLAKGANQSLVDADPAKYFMPQYVAHHGYVGIYLDVGDVDWDEISDLAEAAWRGVAPKTLVKQFDTPSE